MRSLFFHITAIVTLVAPEVCLSQTAKATLEREEMLIGEQITCTLEFEYPAEGRTAPVIDWPEISEKLSDELEIIKASELKEQVSNDDDPVLSKVQQFIITTFDTGYLVLPPFQIYFNDSLYETEPLLLHVMTVEVDTSKGIMDIKPIYEVDYTFGDRFNDFLSWIKDNWYIPLALLISVVVLFLLYRKWKNKAQLPMEVKLPAHVVALQNLDELAAKKLWTQGQTKQHFVELIQIIRIYIENRYGVRAREKTTQEIIDGLKFEPITEDQKIRLRNLLSLADLVKFAKVQPENQDNEMSLQKAYDFVEDTKFTEEDKKIFKEQNNSK